MPKIDHLQELLAMNQEPPPVSLVEKHLGVKQPATTRWDLVELIANYASDTEIDPEQLVDRILDRIYAAARQRQAGWAQLLIRGIKDGRY